MIYDETSRKWDKWAVLEEMEQAQRRESARKRQELPEPTATITSGFGLEVLRLTSSDVKFLTACGVKVE